MVHFSSNRQQSERDRVYIYFVYIYLTRLSKMEVDEDLDAGLLRQFNCLGTTDKEVLIKELQTLVGAHLNDINAKFYLEMTDWNLQAAVCAYFDLQVNNKIPHMTFVKDITIGEGESVPPSTRFIKTWRIQNTGDDGWPGGCSLIFTGGEQLGAPSHVTINSLAAGEIADISIGMVSPSQTGLYSSKWRMSTAQGNFFGDTIWVILPVDSGGTLALMQQMVNLKELGSPTAITQCAPSERLSNPFAPLHLNPQQPQDSTEEQQQQVNGNLNNPINEVPAGGPPTPKCLEDGDGDIGMS